MDGINHSFYANPSSIHTLGQNSRVLVEKSRKTVARSILAKAGEVLFTSGGTEANNLALIGSAKRNRDKGNHIITSKIEHPSILETCNYLSKNGFLISYLDVNKNGSIDLTQIKKYINKQTILISLMMVNNETGCILPIKEVGQLIKDHSIIFHCDAIQALDKIDVRVDEMNCDLLSISAHKIYGPKGCGALFVRQGTTIDPILFGGSQEFLKRPGTENLAAIAGFAEAIRQMQNKERMREKIQFLTNLFEKELKDTIPNLEINGENVPRAPGYSNIYFPFMSGESMLMNLDLNDIAVSTGSACSSGSQKPSHVLQAMGFDDKRIKNSVRFSLGRQTTKNEILRTVAVLKTIYQNSLKIR
jgi:cysteine desulfurase